MRTYNRVKLDRSDIKLVVAHKEYYYNGNNVTCKAYYYVKMPLILENMIGTINDNVIATAVCHKDDTYVKEIGEKIALAKAESKAYSKVRKKMSNTLKMLFGPMVIAVEMANCFYTKAFRACSHNHEYINRISNTEN